MRESFSCCVGHLLKFQDLEHVNGSNNSCFLLRHEKLTRKELNKLRVWGGVAVPC